jgi:hypothetical protein
MNDNSKNTDAKKAGPTMSHVRYIRTTCIKEKFLKRGILDPDDIRNGLETDYNIVVKTSTVKRDLRDIEKKWKKLDDEKRDLALSSHKRNLARISEEIEKKLNEEGVVPTFGNLIQLQKLIADIHGHTKQVVDMKISKDYFDGWNEEELDNYIATGIVPIRFSGESSENE